MTDREMLKIDIGQIADRIDELAKCRRLIKRELNKMFSPFRITNTEFLQLLRKQESELRWASVYAEIVREKACPKESEASNDR